METGWDVKKVERNTVEMWGGNRRGVDCQRLYSLHL
jgi:hypothetical protein